jgi:hypothetical protein
MLTIRPAVAPASTSIGTALLTPSSTASISAVYPSEVLMSTQVDELSRFSKMSMMWICLYAVYT